MADKGCISRDAIVKMVNKAVLKVKMSPLKRHLSIHFLYFKSLQTLFIIQKAMKTHFIPDETTHPEMKLP